ncbi:unnamed protein product [Diamesa hyperborea]
MAFKFIALFAVLAVASAQYHNDYYQPQQAYKQVQPIYQAPTVVKQIVAQPTLVKKVEYEEPANYEFNYSVHDEHTGDIKQQQEVAKDGAISGQYSLIDADGYRRIVDYTADDHHGFNAQVRREPVEGYKAPIQVQKVIAQPQYHSAPAPQYHSAPAQIVQKVIAQPQYYSAPAPAVKKIIAQPQYYSAPAPVKYAAPAQQYYSAPAPAVQKIIAQPQYYSAPAPVKYAAPVQQYTQVIAPKVIAQPQYYAAPAQVVQKVIAQPQYYSAPAPAKYAAPAAHYTTAENAAHVSFSGPSANYHY